MRCCLTHTWLTLGLPASATHLPCPSPCARIPPAPCRSDRVLRALRVCARDLFVPADHREEALVDAPIRVRRRLGAAASTLYPPLNVASAAMQNPQAAQCSLHFTKKPPPLSQVERLDFNISAPHMHATCLEALQLQPGQRVGGVRKSGRANEGGRAGWAAMEVARLGRVAAA